MVSKQVSLYHYITILCSIVASQYIETFSILVLKCWYSRYLLRYRRYRTTLLR